MDIVEIEVTDQKAMKLLLDLEALNLIRVVKKRSGRASLRGRIKTPMTAEEIDQQLSTLREEWSTRSI